MSSHTLVFTVQGSKFDVIERAAIDIGMRYTGWPRDEATEHFNETAHAEVRPLPREKNARQMFEAEIRWPV